MNSGSAVSNWPGARPVLVRAFNVLRQYPVEAVPDAWAVMQARLAPGGLIVDGTCDELGRRCCWVLLDADGPVSLTLACDPFAIERPSDLAERLPKVLIHHNVAGQPIHALLTAADRAWASVAGHGVFGPRVRWRAMLDLMRNEGFPVEPPRRRMRDGVLTVPWEQWRRLSGLRLRPACQDRVTMLDGLDGLVGRWRRALCPAPHQPQDERHGQAGQQQVEGQGEQDAGLLDVDRERDGKQGHEGQRAGALGDGEAVGVGHAAPRHQPEGQHAPPTRKLELSPSIRLET